MTSKHPLMTRILHWLCAVLVLALFFSGWYMVELDYYSPWYTILPEWHILVGCVLTILWTWVLLRLFKKSQQPMPPPHRPLEKHLSSTVKLLFYLLVATMLITGYLMTTADGQGYVVFNFIQLPAVSLFSAQQIDTLGYIHQYTSYLLMVLVGLHTLAALKHHFIDRDLTLKRML